MRQIAIDGQELKVKFKHINLDNIRLKRNNISDDEYLKILGFLNKIIYKALELYQINSYYLGRESYFKRVPERLNGVTVCELSQNKVTKGIGFSFCGKEDQFNKKVGRKISLDRAIYDYTVRRDEERELPESLIYRNGG